MASIFGPLRWAVVVAVVGCGDDAVGGASASGSTGNATTSGTTTGSTGTTGEAPTTGGVTTGTGGMTATTGQPTTTDATSTGAVGSTGPTPMCGDGLLDPDEACDGAELGGETCATQGFDDGTLACDGGCAFDTSGCNLCGDGVVGGAEACDDGNTTPGDGCDASCQIEACDPDGLYTIQGAPVSYSCCQGLVSVNVTSFTLMNDGSAITSSPSNPVAMAGAATTCPMGNFANQGTIPGGCTETYKVSGGFVDANTWSGNYEVVFSGADCTCFNGMLGTPCINQKFPITAKR